MMTCQKKEKEVKNNKDMKGRNIREWKERRKYKRKEKKEECKREGYGGSEGRRGGKEEGKEENIQSMK
jgi:hypothetical protein